MHLTVRSSVEQVSTFGEEQIQKAKRNKLKVLPVQIEYREDN